jgi:protein-S-isoprenylcysteine O-methyltransferase Ste14
MEPESKPWWASKSIIGAIMAGVSLILGAFFGVKIDEATQALVVDQLTAAIAAISTFGGLAMTIWGRIVAKQPISIGSPPINPQG